MKKNKVAILILSVVVLILIISLFLFKPKTSTTIAKTKTKLSSNTTKHHTVVKPITTAVKSPKTTATQAPLRLFPGVTDTELTGDIHQVNFYILALRNNNPVPNLPVKISVPACSHLFITGRTDQNGTYQISTACKSKNGFTGTMTVQNSVIPIATSW